MADTKISDLAALTSLATGDLSAWVDVSDTTMAASGTDKKVTLANVAAAVLASPTTTGTTTLGTLTGLLKGATGVVSAAVAGTDYLAPAAIGVTVQAYDADLGVIAGLADPNADRILFWDDSAGAYAYLTAGSGLSITGTTITASGGGGGVTDHGDLTGLADDDHAQYALLDGRSGGQTLNLGTTSGQVGRVDSTAHATKGELRFNGTTTLVKASGTVRVPDGSVGDLGLAFSSSGNGFYCAGSVMTVQVGGGDSFCFYVNNFQLGSTGGFNWTSNTNSAATADTGLARSAAAVVAVTNGGSGAGALELAEMTAPGTPAANKGRLYLEDNGSGKSRLVVKWDDGATTVLATQA